MQTEFRLNLFWCFDEMRKQFLSMGLLKFDGLVVQTLKFGCRTCLFYLKELETCSSCNLGKI
jgi:hypothetical protein